MRKTELVCEFGVIVGLSCKCGKTLLMDADDAVRLQSYLFNHSANQGRPRIVARKNKKDLNIGAFIIPIPEGLVPDHINGDIHDNRKINLRPATQSQNAMNRKRRSDSTSGFIGVMYKKSHGRWCAQLQGRPEGRHIGLFATKEEAAIARDREAKRVFGEYAKLNFPG